MNSHQIYVDESGKGQEVFVSAGFISTTEKWAAFSREWALALSEAPKVGYFKMSEAMALPAKGQFANFEADQISAKVAKLSAIIDRHAELAFVVAVPDAEFREVFKGKISPTLNSPDFFAHSHLIMRTLQVRHDFCLPGKVDFIFDEMSPAAIDDIRRNWWAIKQSGLAWQRRRMGDEPVMRDEKAVLPLQAADLLAWVWYSRLDAEKKLIKTSRADNVIVPTTQTACQWCNRQDLQNYARNMEDYNNGPFEWETHRSRQKRNALLSK